jgi:hypothetical protein
VIRKLGTFEELWTIGVSLDWPDLNAGLLTALSSTLEAFFVTAIVIWGSAREESLRPLLEALFKRGACYLLFFGPDSENVHDLADAVRCQFVEGGSRADSPTGPEDVIFTVWDETLDPVEIAFELFRVANPSSEYLEREKGRVVICIGNERATQELFETLKDPATAIRRAAEKA